MLEFHQSVVALCPNQKHLKMLQKRHMLMQEKLYASHSGIPTDFLHVLLPSRHVVIRAAFLHCRSLLALVALGSFCIVCSFADNRNFLRNT